MSIIKTILVKHNQSIKDLVDYGQLKLQIETIFQLSFFKKSASYSHKEKQVHYYISLLDLLSPSFYFDGQSKIIYSLAHEYGHGTNFQEVTNIYSLQAFRILSSVITTYDHQSFGLSLISDFSSDKKSVASIRKTYSEVLKEEHRAWNNARTILSFLNITFSNNDFKSYRKECLMSYRKLGHNMIFNIYFQKE